MRLVFALALTLAPASLFLNAFGQQTVGREIAFPISIRWNKQKGVTKYRLQIAADEQFSDVFYDGLITGERYIVRGVSAGHYYWRIAPADLHIGAFSKPTGFFVSGGVVISVKAAGQAELRPKSSATPPLRIR